MNNIFYLLLKHLLLKLQLSLLHIYNDILLGVQEVPEDWINQVVVPILKTSKDPGEIDPCSFFVGPWKLFRVANGERSSFSIMQMK